MQTRCFICGNRFQARSEPAEFYPVVKELVKTFWNYLVPNPSLNCDDSFQICPACHCQYLKAVHKRHTQVVKLRAENVKKVLRYSKVLGQNGNAPQTLELPKSVHVSLIPPPVKETPQADGSNPEQMLATEFKFLKISYQKLPNRSGYKCSACETVTLKTLEEMKKHIRRVHVNQVTDTGRKRKPGKSYNPKKPSGILAAGTPKKLRRLIEISPNKFEYDGQPAERTAGGSFQCGSCPFSTKVTAFLRKHLNEVHIQGRPKMCEVCGKVCKTDQSFYLHRLTHPTGTEQKCDQCAKLFPTRSKLWTHIVYVHKQYKAPKRLIAFVCEFCGKVYKSKNNLDSHMNFHHSNDRKMFDCKLCGRSYASDVALRVHLNCHTGKKDYSCDVCGMKFTQGYSVVRHKKVVHNIAKDQ